MRHDEHVTEEGRVRLRRSVRERCATSRKRTCEHLGLGFGLNVEGDSPTYNNLNCSILIVDCLEDSFQITTCGKYHNSIKPDVVLPRTSS